MIVVFVYLKPYVVCVSVFGFRNSADFICMLNEVNLVLMNR